MPMKIMLQILPQFLTGIWKDNVTAWKILNLDLRSRPVSNIPTNPTPKNCLPIQGVSGGTVNMLEGGSMDFSE